MTITTPNTPMTITAKFKEYRDDFLLHHPSPAQRSAWLWNMDVATHWADRGELFITQCNESVRTTSSTWNELGVLNLLLARENDILFLDGSPCQQLIAMWKAAGLRLPSVDTLPLVISATGAPVDAARGVNLLCFGYSRQEEWLAGELGGVIMGSPSAVARQVNNKAIIKELCIKLGIPTPSGKTCRSLEEVEQTAAGLFRSFERIVIKDPHGSSGKGLMIIRSMQRLQRLIEKFREQFGSDEGALSWVVEGWYENTVSSHNSQYLLYASGRIEFLGSGEQVLRRQVYEGNRFTGARSELPPPALSHHHTIMAQHLLGSGYRGVIGIDSISCSNGEVFPVIEVNGRMNMSTYALAMLDQLHHKGHATLRSYTFKMAKQLPLDEFQKITGEGSFFRKGDEDGVMILGYTGLTSPLTMGVIRVILLYLAPTAEAVASLQGDFERRLYALQDPSGGIDPAGSTHHKRTLTS